MQKVEEKIPAKVDEPVLMPSSETAAAEEPKVAKIRQRKNKKKKKKVKEEGATETQPEATVEDKPVVGEPVIEETKEV